MVDDCLFHFFCGLVWQVTHAVLASAAQEIAVAVAEAVRGLGVDEAGGAFVSFAAVTEQYPLEVMLENSIALAALASEGHHVLDAVEKDRINDRLVASGVDLAFVDNTSDVVTVLQHAM